VKATSQTEARWSALYHLAAEPEGLIQSDLAERMGVQGPTLVRLLDALEAKGLVSRIEAPGDRRAKIVKLEPAGQDTVDEIDVIASRLRDEIFADVTDADLRTTLCVMEQIVNGAAPPDADAARRRRPAGPDPKRSRAR
jgi:MarR family transcriptional regulator for hemolysin